MPPIYWRRELTYVIYRSYWGIAAVEPQKYTLMSARKISKTLKVLLMIWIFDYNSDI